MLIEFVILFVVICILVASYIAPKILLPEEKNIEPLMQCSCSIVTNNELFKVHGLPGVARIALYDDFLVLSNIMKSILNYALISEVIFKKRYLLTDIVVIRTYNESGEVYIYTNKAEKIYVLLHKLMTKEDRVKHPAIK